MSAVEQHPVVIEVAEERARQIAKHGDRSDLPDGTGAGLYFTLPYADVTVQFDEMADWAKDRTDAASHSQGDGTVTFEHILTEEWAEAIAEHDPAKLRAELIQVAAVAVQWVEAIDKRVQR